jgi:hypothetical protein
MTLRNARPVRHIGFWHSGWWSGLGRDEDWLMALSRFEHVEDAPAAEPREPGAAPAALERFAPEKEHEAPHQHEQRDLMRPAPEAHQLRRFDGDGGDGVGLELGHEREMPIKRCHQCRTDLSKFEVQCHACGAPLDTEEARQFNDALWAEQKAQREAEDKAAVESMYRRVRAGSEAQEAVHEALGELERKPRPQRVAEWVDAAIAVGVGLWSRDWELQLICAVVVGAFLLSRAAPGLRDWLADFLQM